MDLNPLLSVVIPAYNEEKYLVKTLRSLRAQSFSDFELIVVDNNSSDNTATIALQFGAKVIRQNKPGIAPSRQAGFEASRGKFIITTDADTIHYADWLSKIIERFDREEVVAVGGLYRLTSGVITARFFFPHLAMIFWKLDNWKSGVWSLPGCNLAIRADAFYKVGGFNQNLNIGEDAEICQRLKKVGKVVFDPELLVITSGRRYHDGLFRGLVDISLVKCLLAI